MHVCLLLVLLVALPPLPAQEGVVLQPPAAPAGARPELVLQVGHADEVKSANWSPDSRFVVTTDHSNHAILWEVATRSGWSLETAGRSSELRWSPDAQGLIVDFAHDIGNNNALQIWDLNQRKPRGAPIRYCSWWTISANWRTLVTDTENARRPQIWDVATASPRGAPLADGALDPVISADGRWIGTDNDWGRLQLWDALAGAPHGPPFEKTKSCQFSPDSRLVALRGEDGLLRVQEVEQLLPHGRPFGVQSPVFSPDSRLLLDAGAWVGLWDAETGQARTGAVEGGYASFSPDGRRLVTFATDSLRLWDPATGQPCGQAVGIRRQRPWDDTKWLAGGRLLLCPQEKRRLLLRTSDGQPIVSVSGHTWALSADGSVLADADNTLMLTSLREVQTGLGAYSKAYGRWALSPDGRSLAVRGEDDEVRLVDVATRAPRAAALGKKLARPVFSPDSRWLLTWMEHESSAIDLWDVGSGARLATLAGRADALENPRYLRSGRALTAYYRLGERRYWSLRSGQPLLADEADIQEALRVVPASAPPLICQPSGIDTFDVKIGSRTGQQEQPRARGAFSSDGQRFACWGDGWLTLREAATGRLLTMLEGRFLMFGGFRAEGAFYASEPTGGLWLRDRTGQRRVRQLTDPKELVRQVAISRDGRTVAVESGFDHAVRLWDVESGQPIGQPIAMGGGRWQLAPTGALLLAANDGQLRLLDVAHGQRLGEAIPCAGEWQMAPDGRTVAAVTEKYGALQLWSLPPTLPRDQPIIRGTVHRFGFSPEGRYLAAETGYPVQLRLWEVATGQPSSAPIPNPNGGYRFSPDGHQLAVVLADGGIRLFACASGRLLATLYSLNDGKDYLTVTPAGDYDGSPGATAAVRWRVGETLYPFDSFAERFNRPERVARALRGEEAEKADGGTLVPPSLAFIEPKYGAELPGGRVHVVIEAAGANPIARVVLTVNGKPLPPALAVRLVEPAPSERRRTYAVDVPLPAGDWQARLQAVAYDTELIRSTVAEVTVFARGAKEQPGTLHVLAVGINRYPRLAPRYALRYAVPDAESIAKMLSGLGGGKAYERVATTLLTDEQATVTNLKFALRDLKDKVAENDTAVLFISGHGVNDQGRFYFPSHEVDPGDLAGTALSWQDFVGAIREVRARHVLILADTCHSGGIVGDQTLSSEALAQRLNREAHQMVFTAAGRDEASIGAEAWGHGAFTKALLEALVGLADSEPKDGAVTYRELRDYVARRTEALTEGRQHPQLPFLESFDPEAVFAQAVYARRGD